MCFLDFSPALNARPFAKAAVSAQLDATFLSSDMTDMVARQISLALCESYEVGSCIVTVLDRLPVGGSINHDIPRFGATWLRRTVSQYAADCAYVNQ